MSNTEPLSQFHTGFGILHSLTLLERETRCLISESIHRLETVRSGLDTGQMPPERAVILLTAALSDLKKLTN